MDNIICTACPRRCGVKRPLSAPGSERVGGFCGVPVLPRAARAGLHLWEEPCISGERGSGTVFFSGCNLKCVFCQNREISTGLKGKEISCERLREIFFELIDKGAHNINLVTPSHFTRSIAEALEGGLPVPVIYNTGAYDSVESLRMLEGKIQIYMPDFKYSDPDLALGYSSAPDYPEIAAAAIEEMFRQTGKYVADDDGMLKSGVLIRHLVLPGNVENTLGVIDRIASMFSPGDVLFSLMRQYTPCNSAECAKFPELTRSLTDEEYDRAEQYLFNSSIEDGFVQEAESADGQYIPCFDFSGV
ncbi:MAG: 4Fe-4S cluster-binding domain-containing protein [Clostridiales bacterium]|nr:4Fe-4S cluster-binding domain-containing protein [Clostridiales bacterium]